MIFDNKFTEKKTKQTGHVSQKAFILFIFVCNLFSFPLSPILNDKNHLDKKHNVGLHA